MDGRKHAERHGEHRDRALLDRVLPDRVSMISGAAAEREYRRIRAIGPRDDSRHPHMSALHDPWMDKGAAARQTPLAIPTTNLLGAWEATSTGTAGAGGTLSLNDLSGNGKSITSTSSSNPLALTASDPLCGGTSTVHATIANNGGVATIAAFSAPFTVYLIGYVTISNGDFVTLGATMIRLFTGLSGTSETWTWRVPAAGNQISDAHGANT